MGIDMVFPNPTVKQVVFQIRFPNLFYIEDKIGELQLNIMKEFPESALLFRRQVVFADMGPEAKIEDIPDDLKERAKRIWQFESPKGFKLNVLGDSLDIESKYHKTYNLGTEDRFRDIIEFAVGNFLQVTSLPIISRIGLRYIDECPLPSKDNATFMSYYNSVFPVKRFDIADAIQMSFRTVVKKGSHHITYAESLREIDGEYKLILDFDGFSENIPSEDYLKVTDELHKAISEEYAETIKEPVYEHMRQEQED